MSMTTTTNTIANFLINTFQHMRLNHYCYVKVEFIHTQSLSFKIASEDPYLDYFIGSSYIPVATVLIDGCSLLIRPLNPYYLNNSIKKSHPQPQSRHKITLSMYNEIDIDVIIAILNKYANIFNRISRKNMKKVSGF